MDVDCCRAVIVEELEDAGDALTAFFVAELVGDGFQKHFEVDAVRIFVRIQVSNHGVDRWVLSLEAKRRHGCLEFARVNSAIAVSVEEGESFANLLNFVLGEAWALENTTSDW